MSQAAGDGFRAPQGRFRPGLRSDAPLGFLAQYGYQTRQAKQPRSGTMPGVVVFAFACTIGDYALDHQGILTSSHNDCLLGFLAKDRYTTK